MSELTFERTPTQAREDELLPIESGRPPLDLHGRLADIERMMQELEEKGVKTPDEILEDRRALEQAFRTKLQELKQRIGEANISQESELQIHSHLVEDIVAFEQVIAVRHNRLVKNKEELLRALNGKGEIELHESDLLSVDSTGQEQYIQLDEADISVVSDKAPISEGAGPTRPGKMERKTTAEEARKGNEDLFRDERFQAVMEEVSLYCMRQLIRLPGYNERYYKPRYSGDISKRGYLLAPDGSETYMKPSMAVPPSELGAMYNATWKKFQATFPEAAREYDYEPHSSLAITAEVKYE